MLKIISVHNETDLQIFKQLLMEYLNWLQAEVLTNYHLEYDCDKAYQEDTQYLDINSQNLFLVKESNNTVGIIMLKQLEPQKIEIKRFYITQRVRGLGYGSQTLTTIIDRMKQRGYTEIILETTSFMQNAHKLYEKIGFRDIAPYEGECPAEHNKLVRYMNLFL